MQPVCTLTGHSDRIWDVCWSPNGQTLASCSGDKTIRIWRATSNESNAYQCVSTLDSVHTRTIRSVAFSPCGRFLAAASFDGLVSIWTRESSSDLEQSDEWTCIAQLEGHENEVKRVSWSCDGQFLASCSRDKTAWIWATPQFMHMSNNPSSNSNTPSIDQLNEWLDDVSSEFQCVSVCSGHSQDVKCVQFHPTEQMMVSCSYDNTMKVWHEEADDWFCCSTITGHTSTVWDVVWTKSKDNIDELISASDDNTVRVWRRSQSDEQEEQQKYPLIQTLTGFHTRSVFSVSMNSNNQIMASGAADNRINLFKRTNDLAAPFAFSVKQNNAHSGDVNCVAFHPNKPDILASAGDDNLIKVWKVVME
jgi:WD40 repeat protein